MQTLLYLFDLFTGASKQLAAYVPQSGSDVIQLFNQCLVWASELNMWISNNIGINLQAILMPIGKLVVICFSFLKELLTQIVSKL